MRPSFHASLINGPGGDPGVFVDFAFERRALLFDLGDLRALAPRKLLRITDVFVSHTHMDHFMGLDWLLRVCLGRGRAIRFFGPPGFLAQVEGRLAGYTWNLVDGYDADLVLDVTELSPARPARRACFRLYTGFKREEETAREVAGDRLLVSEEGFHVRYRFLDHKIPCLAFALEERTHINVWKNRLAELELPTGPWLKTLKQVVRRGGADEEPIEIQWRDARGEHRRRLETGFLKREVLRFVPGQKIAYVTDALYNRENARAIAELARDADALFIEAPFLSREAERAASRFHLTAAQAGGLARDAGAKTVVPFHFSPRYDDGGAALAAEVIAAFAGEPSGARDRRSAPDS